MERICCLSTRIFLSYMHTSINRGNIYIPEDKLMVSIVAVAAVDICKEFTIESLTLCYELLISDNKEIAYNLYVKMHTRVTRITKINHISTQRLPI